MQRPVSSDQVLRVQIRKHRHVLVTVELVHREGVDEDDAAEEERDAACQSGEEEEEDEVRCPVSRTVWV